MKNKIVLVTGGTGSFGKTVVRHLLNMDVFEIRVFSRDEAKQDYMRSNLDDDRVKYYIGDVRDYESIHSAMHSVDYVFHAAALNRSHHVSFSLCKRY